MMFREKIIVVLFLLLAEHAFAQMYVPLEMRGDRKNRKQGLHNGNIVETLFWNFGEVAWWGKQPSGVWPKGTGHSYMDGITPLVAAEVKNKSGKTIHIVEAGYRERMEISPTGVERGFQPRPGFANPNQDNIAMSDNPYSWPDVWPNRPTSWNGKWNGYFGQRTNADQESYFVMDDNSDDGQDFYPDSTDNTRRGLGMRVETRGFQWSNTLAQDNIFWHYDITNESTTDYTKVVFGMYVDAGVGGMLDSNDDDASFSKEYNLTFTWDANGLGEGGWGPTGYAGYAFLESPGNPYNGIDDNNNSADPNSPRLKDADFLPRAINTGDKFVVIQPTTYKRTVLTMPNKDTTVFSLGARYDLKPGIVLQEIAGNTLDDNLNGLIDETPKIHLGFAYQNFSSGAGSNDFLIDERRDNDAGDLVTSWVPDYTKQADAKGQYPGIQKKHWSGDENGNWKIETDDVGADGIAGTSDVGEGDGKPTQGEPHFGKTDKDESDQIGLTAFDIFTIGAGVTFERDEDVWNRISNNHFGTGIEKNNIAFLYGSGPFPLPPGKTERFSLALVFGQTLDELIRHRVTVQQIYNNNYNFARPPEKPRVTIVPGDKKVTLYWDALAEQSYDPISIPPYDFEGYKIYKSTDPGFNDVYTVTDGFGGKTAFQAAAQFDLRNGIGGFFSIDYQGVKFYLGEDKGLQHSWIDSNVVNGQTYYYAVVSYDRGDAVNKIYPSECTKVISRNVYGTLSFDMNTGSATPRTPSAGFTDSHLKDGAMKHTGPGSGPVVLKFIDPLKIPDNKSYRILFDDTTKFTRPDSVSVDTIRYSVFDVTNPSLPKTIIKNSMYISGEDFNPMFDGMRLSVRNDVVAWNPSETKWTKGKTNVQITVDFDTTTQKNWFSRRRSGYPSSYEIRIGAPDSSYSFGTPDFPINFQVWDVTEGKKMQCYLKEPKGKEDHTLNAGDYINLWFEVQPGFFIQDLWRINIIAPIADSTINPDSGSVAYIKINAPFRTGDVFDFTTIGASVNTSAAKNDMSKIAVVPNPYAGAASWEPQRLTQTGRGERRVEFIHLPQRATIRIYSVSGELVQTIEHDGSITDGAEMWNLRSKDNMDVAPGLYIFHVDSPLIGQATGKFAIIK